MNFVTNIHANDGKAPDWLMYLPEGTHEICASVNGKPGKRKVSVSEKCVAALQASLSARRESGDKPCLFFDHKRGTAAAYPDRFEYGTTHDGKKGVMLHIERWSDSGRRAVEGCDYNGFSPTFIVDAEGTPCGLPASTAEIGSLTNEPAFKANARIAACAENNHLAETWNKEASLSPAYATIAAAWEPVESSPSNKMKEYIAEKLGLDPAKATVDEIKAAYEAAETQSAANKAELDKMKEGTSTATAELEAKLKKTEEEKASLEAKLKEQQEANAKQAEAAADAAIEAAVAAGKIAPENATVKASLRAVLIADPANGQAIISAMQVNPALKSSGLSDQTDDKKRKKRTSADDYAEELGGK